MKRFELNDEQLRIMKTRQGFVAALDESGGITPRTLAACSISRDSWSNDDQMFELVHQMRSRVMTSPAFGCDRILGLSAKQSDSEFNAALDKSDREHFRSFNKERNFHKVAQLTEKSL
jgi:hypothetical protein